VRVAIASQRGLSGPSRSCSGALLRKYSCRTAPMLAARLRIAGSRDYKRCVRAVVKPGRRGDEDGVYSYSVLVLIERLDGKCSSCGMVENRRNL
jgi:hypothetical protein